jgi:hypothetical protein
MLGCSSIKGTSAVGRVRMYDNNSPGVGQDLDKVDRITTLPSPSSVYKVDPVTIRLRNLP